MLRIFLTVSNFPFRELEVKIALHFIHNDRAGPRTLEYGVASGPDPEHSNTGGIRARPRTLEYGGGASGPDPEHSNTGA